jgi:glycerophosphoryl diester phosphodiesterase
LNLHRGDGRPLVIGHRGAKAVAPENSLEAIAAAVEAGADLVEFDVSRGLVVSHDERHHGPALSEVLAFLAPLPVGVHVDVKTGGYEQEVLDELAAAGLLDRAVVSTAYASIARRLRALAPDLPVAIGYPRDRYGVSRHSWPGSLTALGAAALRQAMPVRVPLLLASAHASVLALHHALCSRAAVGAAHRRGAPVFAWTANDPVRVRALAGLGVDAIVTDDPKTTLATLIAP